MHRLLLSFFLFASTLPSLVFAAADGGGGQMSGGAATPEIPAGAAPIIVAGIVGAVMLVRSRRNKQKKD